MVFGLGKKIRFEALVLGVWQWLSTRWFWAITLTIFVAQAVFIALFGRFSMAFDEYYHLGTIQQYAKVWFPWSVQQPQGAAVIGSVPTDGSYLYHYLMSFAYRLIEHLTSSQVVQVVLLRLMDVGIVVLGLYLFRRLLLVLGMSRAAAQALLFTVICIPTTPFLAGQLTYDALFFTMTAAVLLVGVTYIRRIREAHTVSLPGTFLLFGLLAATAQIKYAFLPIAVAIAMFIGVFIFREFRTRKLRFAKVFQDWRHEPVGPRLVLVVLFFIVSVGLFAVRYGGNVVRYHSPLPKCDAVLSRERCLAYGPYARDDNHKVLNLSAQLDLQEKTTYPLRWFNQMVYESYFAVGSLELDYPTRSPLPVPYVAGYAFAVLATALVLVRSWYLWRKSVIHQLLLIIVFVYTAVLFAENYRAFLTTGMPVAIHGRYLLQLLPVIGFLAYEALRGLPRWPRMRSFVIGLYLSLMVLGFYTGGITVFVIRSAQDWYFQAAQSITNAVRALLWPFVIR